MKKIILLVFIALSFVSLSKAQDYSTAIGLRGGLFNGLTIKHFTGESSALEGIISTRYKGYRITGLYEKHQTAFQTEQLNFYYGIGGHVAFYNGGNVNWFDDDKDYAVIGVDGILGLEYTFLEIPFNISIDWKPYFSLVGYNGFGGDGGALSIRYIL